MSELDLPKEGLARGRQVQYALGISRGTLYNWVNSGKFPKPVKIGTMVFWRVEDVRQAIADLYNEFSNAPGE